MFSQTHLNTSPIPIPRNAIATSIEETGPPQFPHGVSLNAHPGLASQRRQWPRNYHKFWIHDSSSSSGSSNTSSNSKGHSARSKRSDERRVRTVSPYGSFFAEEMELDVRRTIVFTDPGGIPYRKPLERWERTHRVQSPMGPGPSITGYPANTRPPATLSAPGNEFRAAEMSLSPLSLAINSRHTPPPVSWGQEYPVCPSSPQCDPSGITMAVPGSSISRHDSQRTRGVTHARERR
ncbi:hypothetical protein BGW80DRAFT_1296512 [Lactifluus volemus]|nr:hypothetical protein BGW80DRAFT_1296512 [Lactifluus volemus]